MQEQLVILQGESSSRLQWIGALKLCSQWFNIMREDPLLCDYVAINPTTLAGNLRRFMDIMELALPWCNHMAQALSKGDDLPGQSIAVIDAYVIRRYADLMTDVRIQIYDISEALDAQRGQMPPLLRALILRTIALITGETKISRSWMISYRIANVNDRGSSYAAR